MVDENKPRTKTDICKKINIFKKCRKAKEGHKKTEVEVKRIDLGWMLSDRKEFRDLAVSMENYEISKEITDLDSYSIIFEASWRKV